MALDTFICGTCQLTFNDIEVFILHKKGCQNAVDGATQEGGHSSTAETNAETAATNNVTPLNLDKDQVVTLPEGSQVVTTEMTDSVTGEQQTVIIIQPTNSTDQTAVTQSLLESTLMTAVAQNQNLSGILEKQASTEKPGPGRKRGKRKKTDGPAEKIPKFEKPEVPEIAADGKFHCKCCKRSFYKERFFKTHKCMPTTDYVDITKRDAIADSDDNVSPDSEEEIDDDRDGDFKAIDFKAEGDESEEKDENFVHVSTDPDDEGLPIERATDSIGDIPIFKSEEDKVLFEQSLNVDLSFLDNMFKQHAIEQDLNEKAPMASRMTTSSLSLYSCNSCEKIFKTLSHMRLHCLVHTELRPFKCPKCSYASNAKGNLYTHMRKHTGQYYRCNHCDFKSVNKSHLLEHQATHTNERHQCELCKKDYNTLKSLINHVRKYHGRNPKGVEYLATFLQGGRQRGTTIIHQCHVCNRKFKKKIDRDRHLYVHDIKDIPTIQSCELCDYTASRRVYLEKHFLKHRVIYRCVQCKGNFLSTIKLIDHLTSVHLKDDPTTRWESLFEECINYSLYLPEPDESLSNEEKTFINLPPELSSSEISNDGLAATEKVISREQNTDEVTGKSSEITSEITAEITAEIAPDTTVSELEKRNESANEVMENDKGDAITGKEKSLSTSETGDAAAPKMKENADKNTQADVDDDDLGLDGICDGEEVELNGSKSGEEDGGNEESSEGDKQNRKSIIDTLGYHPMTLQIFHKMRETFGHEECEYCGKLYYHKMDFDQHIRTHTGEKPFPCSICGFRGLTKEVLQQHKESEHEKLMFPCKDCDFVALSRSQLWNHSLRHAGLGDAMGIECPVCQEKMENLKKLKIHVSQQHPESNSEELTKMHMRPFVDKSPAIKHKTQGKIGRRSYKCPYCEKVFIRANSELQKHIWIHEGIKPYKCPLCPHACRSKSNLQAHMLRHSDEKPYSCSECNKAYKSKTALRWHVRSHKAGKIFKCSKCPYEATQSSHLRRHMEIHDIVKRYVCQHCDYSANTLGYMKIHYTKNHKGETYKCLDVPQVEETEKKSPNDAQVYRCLSCDYLFGNLSDLKRHLKVRHHLQIQHIQGLEANPQGSSQTTTEVQVLQYSGDNLTPDIQQVAESNTITTDNTVEELDTSTLDEKTASAVNILQQIFGMSQQTPGTQQHFTVQSDDGEVVAVNQDTIIVQQEGEEVLVTDGNSGLAGNQQYVIQYVSPQDGQIDSGSLLEVQTVGDVQSISHVGDMQTIDGSQEIIHAIDQQVITEQIA